MNNPLDLIVVFGTRPEIIKMAPVVNELSKYPDRFIVHTCFSGQHKEMAEPLLRIFGLIPTHDLGVMKQGQDLTTLTAAILTRIDRLIDQIKPDFLLVQGDSTTAMAASLSAFYHKVKIAHVEAGLRTWDNKQPFPEEANRTIIDAIADVCFVPSVNAKNNLLRENVPEGNIYITGNTVIDALKSMDDENTKIGDLQISKFCSKFEKTILVTIHRRENHGEKLIDLCKGLVELAKKYAANLGIIFPVHLNPQVRKIAYDMLADQQNILLVEPLSYEELIPLIKKVYFIMTDSGGLQEEAPYFAKPVLILRDVTERPEVVECGVGKIVGTRKDDVTREASILLDNESRYSTMAKIAYPYGVGDASKKIVDYFLEND